MTNLYHEAGFLTNDSRSKMLKIARQLGYGKEVISRLQNAENEVEASRIMTSARKGEYDGKREEWEERPCIY